MFSSKIFLPRAYVGTKISFLDTTTRFFSTGKCVLHVRGSSCTCYHESQKNVVDYDPPNISVVHALSHFSHVNLVKLSGFSLILMTRSLYPSSREFS